MAESETRIYSFMKVEVQCVGRIQRRTSKHEWHCEFAIPKLLKFTLRVLLLFPVPIKGNIQKFADWPFIKKNCPRKRLTRLNPKIESYFSMIE